MTVVRIRHPRPGYGRKDYDAIIEKFRPHETPPEGLIVRTYGQNGGQWEAIEIWESAEDADRYEREVTPAARQVLGEDWVPSEHTTYEVYDIIRGRSGWQAGSPADE